MSTVRDQLALILTQRCGSSVILIFFFFTEIHVPYFLSGGSRMKLEILIEIEDFINKAEENIFQWPCKANKTKDYGKGNIPVGIEPLASEW